MKEWGGRRKATSLCAAEESCFFVLRVIWQLRQLEYKPATLLFLSKRTWQQILGFLRHLARDRMLRLNWLYLQFPEQEGDLHRSCHEVGKMTYTHTLLIHSEFTYSGKPKQSSLYLYRAPLFSKCFTLKHLILTNLEVVSGGINSMLKT